MKTAFAILFFALLCHPATLPAAQSVDLQAAVRLALENNLNLRAQTYSTQASEALVRRGYGLYDPRLGGTLSASENRDLTFQRTVGTLLPLETSLQQGNLFASQRLPWGTDLQVDFLASRNEVNPSAIDSYYRGELSFSLAQPLLRNFGRETTEQQILFAIYDRNISVQDLRERAFQIISEVHNSYFDVQRFRADLSYRQRSVDLAKRVLAENRARVDAGVLAPVEILEAEVGLLTRERELLDAERVLGDILDRLKLLIQATEPIRVADETLGLPALEPNEEQGFRTALEMRPDLLRRDREIERQELTRRLARNQTLPVVDIIGRYGHRSLDDRYGTALGDLSSNELRNWEVGLTFSYPLGNREARNELVRSRLLLRSLEALRAQLREETRTEIRNAIRLLEVSAKRVEVTSRGVDLAEEKLRTLLKRQEVGLVTTRQVLEGEEDLAAAQTERSTSLADYNKAVTEYLRVTGRLLEHQGVRFVGAVDPDRDEPLLRIAP